MAVRMTATVEDAASVLRPWFHQLEKTGFAADVFLDGLADDVLWTATGTSAVSGRHVGKAAYVAGVYEPLNRRLAAWPRPVIERIVTDGDWGVVQFRGEGGVGVNGCDYSMRYCWVMRVAGGLVCEVIGYYDTAKVQELFS